MKFDRKARALLLYVFLPIYVILLGVFVYVSNVYMGRYPLPKERLAADFVEFASGGYVLNQELSLGGEILVPGTAIEGELGEKIVRAYGAMEMMLKVTSRTDGPKMGIEIKIPATVESAEFTDFLAADYVLDETAAIRVDGDEVIKEPGTKVDRSVLLGLMAMRDEKLRDENVKVRGEGPVIGFQYTFIFILLNFAILVLFLYGLLWKPVLAVLDKRTQSVEKDLSQAHDHRKQAQDLYEKYRAEMDGAREEREEIVAGGRREGESERERIIDEARAEAQSLMERARLSIDSEREEARRELTAQVGAFSVELASRILEREIKEADHDALVDDFVSKIGSSGEKTEE